MANRVVDAEVHAIKVTNPTDLDTTPWITAANSVVNSINDKCGTDFDEATLGQIELFLAAHFVGAQTPLKIEEKFENYSQKFSVGSQVLKGILTDKNGQIANTLSCGCLQELDKELASVDFL